MSDNLVRAILDNGRKDPARACLRYYRDGGWRDMSWGTFVERARRIAGGLAVLGVEPGRRVAILSANRPEWALADIGAIAAGAVVTTVYPTLTPDETAFILAHSQSCAVFVQDRVLADKVRSVREKTPLLRHVIVLEGDAADGETTLGALERLADDERIERTVAQAARADRKTPATVVYTSGTTGVPKGVILTHGNVLGTLESVFTAFGDDTSRLQVVLSFLPLAHSLERMAGHFLPLIHGRTIAYARSLETLPEDFLQVRPDCATAVPRVFEKVGARIHAQVAAKSKAARRVFEWAVGVGTKRSLLLERGKPIPPLLRAEWEVADRLVAREIRARLGGNLKFFVSGGAPLAPDLARFFHAMGILILEGWGATETSAPSTWNTPRAYRLGSVGRVLPDVDVKIAQDGELLVRGVNVFAGYLDAPQETAEAFDADGYWKTGDIGTRDEDGYFYITDRKKELIVLSSGKNIAPQKLESQLRRQPFVSNALVHGDRRNYLVALLTVDRSALEARHPELAGASPDDPRVREKLAASLEAANAQLARFEQLKDFRIVPHDFSPETGELTLTLKLKRREIERRHRALLDAMYEE